MHKVRKVKHLGKNVIFPKEIRVNVLCRNWSKADCFMMCRMEFAIYTLSGRRWKFQTIFNI